MANGGYTGNSPSQRTSPEQYSGVWELTEQFQAQADGNWPFQETDCAPKSLRFDGSSSPSASLSRTPLAASDRRTWSWSAWIKRGKIGSEACIFTAGANTANTFRFNSNDTLKVNAGSDGSVETVARFRDPSAWLHLLVTLQTGAVTDSDRLKIYVNNVLQTVVGTYPTKDGQGAYNEASVHYVGRQVHNEGNRFDGLIANLQFIDGQALTPDAFTFIDGQGVLQPKRFTGDYSTGSSVGTSGPWNSGFSSGAVSSGGTHSTNGNTNILTIDTGSLGAHDITITKTGGANDIYLVTSATNSGYSLVQNNITTVRITNTGTPSHSLSRWVQIQGSGGGQVTVTITGTANGSLGLGYNSFHLDFSDGAKDQSGLGNDWTANNIEFPSPLVQDWESMLTGAHDTNHGWGTTYGSDNMFDGILTSYTIGQANSTGLTFTPTTALGASATTIRIYGMDDACPDSHLKINGVNYGGLVNAGTGWTVLKGTGQVGSGITSITSIYLRDNSTGNQHYRFGALEIDGVIVTQGGDPDLFVDSPVNGNQTDAAGLGGIVQGNYASMNPLDSNIGSNLTNGNLDAAGSTNWSAGHARGTFALTSGKWYWEVTKTGGSTTAQIGFCNKNFSLTNSYGSLPADSWTFNFANGTEILRPSGGGASYFSGGAMADGDVAGIALDMDNKTAVFYKNGTAGASIDLAATSTASTSNIDELFPLVGVYNANVSFNGGQGAYKYQNAGTDRPSADYKSLCTTNLPEPSILFPSQYFDTKLWSGNSGDGLAPTQDITTSFAPSFVWIKSRTDVNGHSLFDIVRGIGKRLHTNTTGPETTKTQTLSNFLTNGFRINGDNSVNDVGQNYVSWSWAGGDATTTIAANSIRAVQNVTAGNDFSAGWAGFNQSFWANTDSWSNLPARNGNAKGYWPNTETLSDGHVFNSPDFGSISSGTGGHVLRASSSCTLKFTVYSHITEIAITTSDSQTFADRTIIATNPTANSIVEATGKCFWFSTTSAVPNIGAIGTVNNAPALPSIASTVRSSPESGFSIVKATAGGSYGMMSIGHGLNQKPSMVFTKRTDNPGGDWLVHTDVTGSILQLELNKTDAGAAGSSYYSVGSNTFSLYHGHFTDNNHELINYCFAPIEGFSSFGSYTNPSGSEGAFVFLGFKPELIIIKCAANISSSNGLGDWIIKDATRSPFNNPSDGNTLVANVNNAEDNYYSSGQVAIDILSNGFKIRHPGSGPAGDTGRVYIYAAWAESPFKTARAN